ncbi:MAG: type II secretion system F family protein [Patescibacteria group bacterium]|jgi:type IV pilus assembly protein PilC
MPVDLKSVQTAETKEKTKSSIDQRINNFLLKLSSVPEKEKLFFLRNLGVMLKAGISLSSALRTLARQTESKKFSGILIDIAQKVEKGDSFHESLHSHEKIFGELFISMIEAGEISGKLEEVLGQVYIQSKRSHELKSKVKSALAYPVIVLVSMSGIGAFMIVFIVPKITEMFEGFSAELPLPTKILIAVSNAIVANGLLSAAIFIAAVISLIAILRTRKGKYYFQYLILHAPVFSPIIKKINLANFARVMGSLLKTDIMIIKSFQIAANVSPNLHYREALRTTAEKIKKGEKISDTLSAYPALFPPLVTQMVAVGEETGELDSILTELAEFYEEEVFQIMETLPSLIEPLLILILGCGIGAMAVAIIMPMYSLTTAI